MAKHAVLSPSSALKWVNCPGSKAAELLSPSGGGFKYADEGTAAHFLASETLLQKPDKGDRWTIPLEWQRKRSISVEEDGAKWYLETDDPRTHLYITPEMADFVQDYVNSLRDFCGDDGLLFVEQSLPLTSITGEPDAYGTSDAIVIRGTELQVHDLKYGMKVVKAVDNQQLLLYAAAALGEYSSIFQIDKVTMVIHQPRIAGETVSTWSVDAQYIERQASFIGAVAKEALDATTIGSLEALDRAELLLPGDHCRNGYCSARATCPALHRFVVETSGDLTVPSDNKELADKADAVPIIEDWCKQVIELVNTKVLDGENVPGFKAVKGREGNRKWDDEAKVEEILTKSMKIPHDIVYKKSLNSPTVLEKAAKAGDIGPRQWPKIVEHIIREPAGTIVVPESDKRPAIEISNALDLL